MSEVTLQKTHSLLEKLAEYVMGKIPHIEEKLLKLEVELAKKVDKSDLVQKADKSDLVHKADKSDVQRIEDKLALLLDGMDAQAGQLAELRMEKIAVSRTLDIHENRLGNLEEKVLGFRVRDREEKGRKV